MKERPKVSIIVPIYNAGSYLERCLDTIVNQTLKEVEIILVLDCPTDGSDKVAEEYARRDGRIKLVVNAESQHIGLSRNIGLEVATGEYVAFSDHDDYRELDMYEALYERAEKERVDIVFCWPALVEGGKCEIWEYPVLETKYTREYCLTDLLGKGNYRYECSRFCNIHNGLYRREFLLKNAINFVDTRHITPEDVIFQTQAVFLSEKASICPKAYYYHVMHPASAGHSYGYGEWRKRARGLDEIYRFLQRQDCYEAYEVLFLLQVRRQLLSSLLGMLLHKKSIKEFTEALCEVKNYPFVRRAFRFYSYNEHTTLSNPLKKALRQWVAWILAR